MNIKLLTIFIILSIALFETSCFRPPPSTGDWFVKCKKDGQKSIRIVPKNDPFKPKIDSINTLVNATVSNLNGISPKFEFNRRRFYEDKVKALTIDHISFYRLYKHPILPIVQTRVTIKAIKTI